MEIINTIYIRDIMKIKKNQLKHIIKQIVREAIDERVTHSNTKNFLNEAGLTSETSNQTQGYNENEELVLIKVMKLISDKLLAMHGNQTAAAIGMATAEYPTDNEFDAESGEDTGEEIPLDNDESGEEFPSEEEPVDVEFSSDEESPEDDAFPADDEEPEGNEFLSNDETPEEEGEEDEETLDEASYKIVPKRSYETADDMKARTIQYDPEIAENHKVQIRSYRTSNDNASDPNKVRDPEVPSV